jgi:hypothetical protein
MRCGSKVASVSTILLIEIPDPEGEGDRRIEGALVTPGGG